MRDVETELQKLIVDSLFWGEDGGAVKPEAAFIDDLGCDSLDHLELVIAAENQFDIEIGEKEARDLLTVSDAIKLVRRKIEQRADA